MALTSDPVAVDVATDVASLQVHGTVCLSGYLLLTSTDVETGTDEEGSAVFTTVEGPARLYTNTSFDHWLDIPRDKVRSQLPNRSEDGGRSFIWVDADTAIVQGVFTTAGDVAQALAAGSDDPTAYPHGGTP